MVYYVYKYNGNWSIDSVLDNNVSDFIKLYKDCNDPILIKSEIIKGSIDRIFPMIMDIVVFNVVGNDKFFYNGKESLSLPYIYVTPHILYINNPSSFVSNIKEIPSSLWTLFLIGGYNLYSRGIYPQYIPDIQFEITDETEILRDWGYAIEEFYSMFPEEGKYFKHYDDVLFDKNNNERYIMEGQKVYLQSKEFKIPNKTVDVVILSWNDKENTLNTYRCFRNYCKNIRIIGVDNGSTDGTSDIVKGMADVPILLKENVGAIEGRNIAKNYIESDYVLFSDSDILFNVDVVSVMASIMEKDEKIGAIGPYITQQGLPQSFNIISSTGLNDLKEYYNIFKGIYRELEPPILSSCFMMVRKNSIDKVGWFDPVFSPYSYEDSDLSVKIKEHGYKVCLSEGTIVHHITSSSVKKNMEGKRLNDIVNRNRGIFNKRYPYYNITEDKEILKMKSEEYLHYFISKINVGDISELKKVLNKIEENPYQYKLYRLLFIYMVKNNDYSHINIFKEPYYLLKRYGEYLYMSALLDENGLLGIDTIVDDIREYINKYKPIPSYLWIYFINYLIKKKIEKE